MFDGGALAERMVLRVTGLTRGLFWILAHAPRRSRTRGRAHLFVLCLGIAFASVFTSTVRADATSAPSASETPEHHSFGRTLAVGTAGVLSGFLAHEAGHVAANLALGNRPRFEGFLYGGFLPFFAITPCIQCDAEGCTDINGQNFGPGRRGKYFIVTAGYHVQHISDEIILSHTPDLRHQYAPFRKGMLLFNIFLSTLYAAGAWTGLQDPHGDLEGAAQLSGLDQTLLSFALVAPAAIDTYRYFVPGSARWSAWASRLSKGAFAGLNFAF